MFDLAFNRKLQKLLQITLNLLMLPYSFTISMQLILMYDEFDAICVYVATEIKIGTIQFKLHE